jgi:dihydroorotate dehydrogenase (NAD+) catalytic subunit
MTRLTRVLPATRTEVPLPDLDMGTTIDQLVLPNPLMTASGCAGYGRELDPFVDLTELGAVVTKSIMLRPRAGRATPRMAETPSGMLNSIGLQGSGIDAFLERDLAWLEARGARAIVSIAGNDAEDFARLAARLRHSSTVKGIEVNISCPNVANRGLVFACDPESAASVISGVRRNCAPGVPVIAKLSPDVTDIVAVARACVDAGADALCLINTLLGMVIDTDTMRPHLAGVTGGLSGPAIRPVAVRAVWQVHAAMPEIPIIGVGGVRTGLDALELVLAGASAVQVGTVVFHDPSSPIRVLHELQRALAARGFDRFADAVGYAHRPPPPAAAPHAVAVAPADGDEPGGTAADAPAGAPADAGDGSAEDDWSEPIEGAQE